VKRRVAVLDVCVRNDYGIAVYSAARSTSAPVLRKIKEELDGSSQEDRRRDP
jgi:hypothetical protein